LPQFGGVLGGEAGVGRSGRCRSVVRRPRSGAHVELGREQPVAGDLPDAVILPGPRPCSCLADPAMLTRSPPPSVLFIQRLGDQRVGEAEPAQPLLVFHH
jgi:hypothetical protein